MWTDAGPAPWAVVAWFALLGAALGSFLNVCILRWGAEPKQSVMHPPSRCPSCGHAIRWHENIPVLSWLVLRGKCSGCGARISPMYPAIEAGTALIWGGSVALFGLNPG
ncbi:MAG TPA: prepilin peptidase, partial [Gemmatimonadales bacterium]